MYGIIKSTQKGCFFDGFELVLSILDTYRNNKFLFLQFTLRLKRWCDWLCKVNEPLKILAQKNTLCYCLSYHTKTNLQDRKSTRLNSSHVSISYAVFCLKKKKQNKNIIYIQTNTRIN